MEAQFIGPQGSLIFQVDNAVPVETCSRVISHLAPLDQTLFFDGRTMGGLMPLTKVSRDCYLGNLAFQENGLEWGIEEASLEASFIDALTGAIALYRSEVKALEGWQNIMDTGFQVQRYLRHHGFYREHIDSMPPDSSANRILAAIFYLNTVDHGGETNFPSFNVRVKPEAGRLILFPATWTHPHAGLPPVTNEKWIISTFITNSPDYNEDHDHTEHDHTEHDHPSTSTVGYGD